MFWYVLCSNGLILSCYNMSLLQMVSNEQWLFWGLLSAAVQPCADGGHFLLLVRSSGDFSASLDITHVHCGSPRSSTSSTSSIGSQHSKQMHLHTTAALVEIREMRPRISRRSRMRVQFERLVTLRTCRLRLWGLMRCQPGTRPCQEPAVLKKLEVSSRGLDPVSHATCQRSSPSSSP